MSKPKPLLVRAVAASVGPCTLLIIILWGIDYPRSEWPFLAGVLCVSMYVSSVVLLVPVLLALKWLTRSAHRALAARGLDPETVQAQGLEAPVTRYITATVLFALSAAIWGIAIHAMILVAGWMTMPPLNAVLGLAASTALGFGGFVVLLFLGTGAAVIFALANNRSLPSLLMLLNKAQASGASRLALTGALVPRIR